MFNTVAEIKAANRARGHHFFDAATMRFFRSKVAPGVIGGRYFVTSEQFCSVYSGECDARFYQVRRANEDGSIDTMFEREGEINGERFATLERARTAARRLAEQDAKPEQVRTVGDDLGLVFAALAAMGADIR